MSSDSKTINAVNIDLRMLATLRAYQKIDTKNNIIYNDSVMTTIRRTFNTLIGINGSSRNDLLIYIENTLSRAFEMARKYIHSPNEVDRSICANMIINVNETLSSLETNVLSTYSTDTHFTVKLTSLISNMRNNLASLQNKEFHSSILLSHPIDTVPSSPEYSGASGAKMEIAEL